MRFGTRAFMSDLEVVSRNLPRRRRWELAGLVLLMLAGAVAEMATLGAVVPFLALLSDPGAAASHPWTGRLASQFGLQDSLLGAAAVAFVAVALLAATVRILLTWWSYRFSFAVGEDIAAQIYRQTLSQPYAWHVSHNSSETIGSIIKVNNVVSIVTSLLQGVVGAIISVAILGALLAIDAHAALLAGAAFSFLYVATTLAARPILRENSDVASRNETLRIQALQEGLGSIRDVILDRTQGIYQERFAAHDRAMRRAQASTNFISAAPRFVVEALGMVIIIGLAYWLNARHGSIAATIPVLGALAVGAQKMLPQMQLIYYAWSSITGNMAAVHEVVLLLERSGRGKPGEREGVAVNAPPKPGQTRVGEELVAFDGICFGYHAHGPQVLRGVSLKIRRGDRIGLIGRTGSGKSTFVDILMGLLVPEEGVVSVQGQAVPTLDDRNWQARIAHVPQTIYLMDTTIAENIAFGVPRPDIDMARVRLAAEKAQLADHIRTLPEGFSTMVGERGVRLSGGQRQRVGLARAFYKSTDLVVLDEATSALDDETERLAMTAIDRLPPETTVIMIAHRLSTLRNCNRVLEFNGGRVEEVSPEKLESRHRFNTAEAQA